ncbi:hypothetical protein CDL15_Pgr000428 [Punica granatum]|uniref:Exportin-5 C-terminal domain-containing protein n=1 Tax=Punica granatum TaxID=22663 RepID=A0A218W2W3_PUNGR|nr:hypothetical protein CDL15_Pgr000428 [Punica granatum]
MEDPNSIAGNVARALLAALDWRSTPGDRKAAVSFIESIKAGDVRVLVSASFTLVKKNSASEIRLQAFKLLQHLVRLRWEELNPEERRNFANAAVELMSESANPCEEWAIKSQTAALVAEIVRREGLNLWQELLPALVSLSNNGPIQLLERHFGVAMSEAGRQQFGIAKQHAAAVTAILNAVTAYAEWAPLSDLAKYGIIHGCGVLLSSPDFHLHACEFFKLVSPRKRPPDDSASEFDAAMGNVFQILMNVSREFLYRSASSPEVIKESEYECAEYICESMVSLGSSNLQCIAGDSTTLSLYLQQMVGYYQHYKLALHYQSLLFWLALMRDLLSKPKIHGHSSGGESSTASSVSSGADQVDSEKKRLLSFIHDDICTAILEMSFLRLVKKEKVLPETAASLRALELWSDDFEGKGDFGQYRSRLLELIRFVAAHKPLIAAGIVSERIISIINTPSLSSVPTQDLAVTESMHSALENVVNSVFSGMDELPGGSAEVQLALCSIFEGLLQQLLALKWTEPTLVEVLGHYLDALGPFLKYSPNAVGSVINKLFELLTSLPFAVKDPATSTARHARLQICTSFIRIAKAADKSILPHMKGIADTMGYLQREGRLLRAEHNILGEAFLVMASVAGVQQQQEVLAWLLEPLSQQWVQVDWQNNYLSEPSGLVRLCMETPVMWSVFHTVTFFEKALKRSGFRKVHSQSGPTGSPATLHPMASHLSWMLPPLFKLLRVIHSFWSPSVIQVLPAEIKAAMIISDTERTSLLGEGASKSSKTALTFVDGSQVDLSKEGRTEPNEIDIRNWLKGVRDSGYNVLGLATTIGESFYKCLDAHYVAVGLMENIQSMEFRHMRQLIHSVIIPVVKFCPPDLWEIWLEKLLHPLFVHSQQALSISWASLLHEGRSKVPDYLSVSVGELKVEVMEEKLLRDLTREICSLLSVIASPALNTGLPSLEQSGHANRVDSSSLKELESFSQSSMVSFLMKHKHVVLPVLQMCLEVFTWTDGEATSKVCSFCSTVFLLAISTNNVELREFVSKDLFSAIIRGLSLESNAIISADLVNLCREIFVYLCDRDPAPRQVLLSLPCIKPQDLAAFEEALTKTLSPKEQKQHMKSLLVLATGNKLKALAAQKSVNIITNVSMRPRSNVNAPEPRVEDGEHVGLAAIL